MKIKELFKSIYQRIKNFIFRITHKTFLEPISIVNYVFTAESLPEPLKLTDEIDLVRAFTEEGDLCAKSKLIEHNLRLVMYISKKFENNKVEMQELISIGSLGLIKAVDSYRLDKNTKFATYASRCIENEILMYLRKIKKSINDISLDDALTNDEEERGLTLGEMLPDENSPYKQVEAKDEKNFLINAISGLNDREQKIMNMRYGLNGQDELTQKEVADLMNISQSYISRLEKKILHKLKIELSKIS